MRNRLIKDMILKSGCNVDDGNLPETLKMKKETHCKEPIKERVLLQFISTNHITPNEHKDISSVGIHGQDLQQHANDVMTYGGRLSTQTCATKCDSDTSQQSPSSFQPRSPKEPIRNCTTLERSLKEHIVNTVARHLLCLPLTSDNLSSPSRSVSEVDKQGNCAGASASKWRKGGKKYSLFRSCSVGINRFNRNRFRLKRLRFSNKTIFRPFSVETQ